mmetsp:Transcript_10161/g.30523  ORF Transcript_10161/g.30523 Transcript_10161/m.30523 type:complete len:254 (+) Transcript_10161:189-950(+)
MGDAVENSQTPIQRVVVLIAMEAEAKPLLELLGLQQDKPQALAGPAPAQTFSGSAYGLDLHIVCNGKCRVHGVDQVGTVPAALTAYLALEAFKPDLIISAGTAGGFKAQGGAVGDVYVGSSVMNHDRRIPIPGFDAYGIGAYDAVRTPKLASELSLKDGIVSSGNSLGYSKEDMELMVQHGVAVKEMEAAAIAWAAHLFATPFLALKAITDIVDGDKPTNEEFLANLSAAAYSLQEKLPLVLQFVAGKSVSEL